MNARLLEDGTKLIDGSNGYSGAKLKHSQTLSPASDSSTLGAAAARAAAPGTAATSRRATDPAATARRSTTSGSAGRADAAGPIGRGHASGPAGAAWRLRAPPGTTRVVFDPHGSGIEATRRTGSRHQDGAHGGGRIEV